MIESMRRLKVHIASLERMMQKHYPAYEYAWASGNEIDNLVYVKYAKIHERMNVELDKLRVQIFYSPTNY